ncbi:DDE-type integrase/transposase/recombinase [Rhodocytophaga aerolata]|uniref:DDE-type integrase/transposase/recombinase n=1 Tax=Rhodocytophaga aerolata TaxID=455078 RepID=A0ABT8RCF1_9BACT|nr:DDE-type integrase/transposase/recombinase [Rhodocytophaga aerolata]MDO1449781.1 DDE-type integrase/transposase/recombinase [Rhodocytophaga aerolata]
MKSYFRSMYLVAIIDVYSRFVVGWDISNNMDADWVVETLQTTLAYYGKPQIVNSDQGSQFTCKKWVEHLKGQQILISMDGKGRAVDNVYIERLWRTVKYEVNHERFTCLHYSARRWLAVIPRAEGILPKI